jgi:hypothetical protein
VREYLCRQDLRIIGAREERRMKRVYMAERVGFGLSPDIQTTQVIGFTKSQKRQIRTKSRSEVHRGYMESPAPPVSAPFGSACQDLGGAGDSEFSAMSPQHSFQRLFVRWVEREVEVRISGILLAQVMKYRHSASVRVFIR